MKYLKRFKQTSEYEAFKAGDEYVLPNVSFVVENAVVAFNPHTASANLIEFTIDGISYQAEEDMTWQEFAESSYNDGRISISSNYVNHDGMPLTNTSSGMSAPWDVIVSGYNYEYAAV